MDSSVILSRLCKEKKDWKNTIGIGPEVRWIIRGIDISIHIVRLILREQRVKKYGNPREARHGH